MLELSKTSNSKIKCIMRRMDQILILYHQNKIFIVLHIKITKFIGLLLWDDSNFDPKFGKVRGSRSTKVLTKPVKVGILERLLTIKEKRFLGFNALF